MESLVGDHDDLQQLSSFVVSLVDPAAYDYELREDGAAGREAALVLDVYERNLALQRVLHERLAQVDAAVSAGDKLYSRLHAVPSVPDLFETRRPRRSDENEGFDKNLGMAAQFRMEDVQRAKWTDEERVRLNEAVQKSMREILIKRIATKYGAEKTDEARAQMRREIEVARTIGFKELVSIVGVDSIDWRVVGGELIRHGGRSRTIEDCRIVFCGTEDPRINQEPWRKEDDELLVKLVEKHGGCEWDLIAAEMGNNRTVMQCLRRYQRSWNKTMINSKWSDEEDEQLRQAVLLYGEKNWAQVANVLEGRTGTQCMFRWQKALKVERKGRWTAEEDRCLSVAVEAYRAEMESLAPAGTSEKVRSIPWRKICEWVSGRSDAQCRERYVNCLAPSVSMDTWNDAEDASLLEIVREIGAGHWAVIASRLKEAHGKERTDNQCWRRWRQIAPRTDVVDYRQKKAIARVVLPSNFSGRRGEKPSFEVGAEYVQDEGMLESIRQAAMAKPVRRGRRSVGSRTSSARKRPARTRASRSARKRASSDNDDSDGKDGGGDDADGANDDENADGSNAVGGSVATTGRRRSVVARRRVTRGSTRATASASRSSSSRRRRTSWDDDDETEEEDEEEEEEEEEEEGDDDDDVEEVDDDNVDEDDDDDEDEDEDASAQIASNADNGNDKDKGENEGEDGGGNVDSHAVGVGDSAASAASSEDVGEGGGVAAAVRGAVTAVRAPPARTRAARSSVRERAPAAADAAPESAGLDADEARGAKRGTAGPASASKRTRARRAAA